MSSRITRRSGGAPSSANLVATNSGVSKANRRCEEWLSSNKRRARTRAETTRSSQFKEAATGATDGSQGSPASGSRAETRKTKSVESLESVKTRRIPEGEARAQRNRKSELQDSSFIPETIKEVSSSASDEVDTIFTLSDGADNTLPSTLVSLDDDDVPKGPPPCKTRTKHADSNGGSQSSLGTKRTNKGGKGGTKKTRGTEAGGTSGASNKSSTPTGVTKKKKQKKKTAGGKKRGRKAVPPGWSEASQSGESTD